MSSTPVRVRAHIGGTVQGVGFRPFVYRLAVEQQLAGWVRNDRRGVLLEVEGSPMSVQRFLRRLRAEKPPLACVAEMQSWELPTCGRSGFSILTSDQSAAGTEVAIAPDVAPCERCLRELFDPADRRFRYPFINCTDCGPRFTIVIDGPYDRQRTTMAGFSMCANCRAEFEDPLSRRFHAQPNACPSCGPALELLEPTRLDDGPIAAGEQALRQACAALADGLIVAVKGVGGYHLATRADSQDSVQRLRARKHRSEKPFALMAADLRSALELIDLPIDQRTLLLAPQRPIVIAPRADRAPVASAVAARHSDLGVMLPSTPLHHLLLHESGTALVMTSGNVSEEPIAYRDDDAIRRLSPIADLILTHDRPIHVRADDSIFRLSARGEDRPMLLRRARGFIPTAIDLPHEAQPLLACGAQSASTFCLARGSRAWVSQHLGDLSNWETLRAYREAVGHLRRLLEVTPTLVVHDLHPDYLSSAYAMELEGLQTQAVQHHHAHFAAVLAEHRITDQALGAVYDGSGLGSDGTIWGGELLAGAIGEVRRVGSLHAVPLPGGDAAVTEPWRMACAWMLCAADGRLREPPPTISRHIDAVRWEQVATLAANERLSRRTSSVGRLFDAVAAMCGVRLRVHDEGRAAIELEALADAGHRDAYPMAVGEGVPVEIDPRETIEAILEDLAHGVPVALISARFHNALADATVTALRSIAERLSLQQVTLSGGVFQNRLLLDRTRRGLHDAGLQVLLPQLLPPNDGAISYGQAAVAAALASAGAGAGR